MSWIERIAFNVSTKMLKFDLFFVVQLIVIQLQKYSKQIE